MTVGRLPKILFPLVVMAAIAECVRDFPLLPPEMASHFNGTGLPSHWMAKPYFFDLYAGLVALSALLGFLVPPLISVIPTWAFNLPHKEYWLAPDQFDRTYAYLDGFFSWSGLAFLLFEVFIMHLVFEANLQPIPQIRMISVDGLIAAFVLFNILATVSLLRRFSRPSPPSSFQTREI